MDAIFKLARSLEVAKAQAQTYIQPQFTTNAVPHETPSQYDMSDVAAALPIAKQWACYFCGGTKRHKRAKCPAKDEICGNCGIKGHIATVCKGQPQSSKQVSAIHFLAASPPSLAKSICKVVVNNIEIDALIDSGSSVTFLNEAVANKYSWTINSDDNVDSVCMASSNLVSQSSGTCSVNLNFCNELFPDKEIKVMKNLCADMIIGLDVLSNYSSITLQFGGVKDPLVVCSARIDEPPTLFGDLDPACKPIAVKSRRFSKSDKIFIKNQVDKLSQSSTIRESTSPWRAQVFVHRGDEIHRDRMIIDFSQTINRFTNLDAYPVPRIDEMVEDLSQYKHFTTYDLSSAYHQIPIAEHEKKFTAFEACGKLYEFNFVPLGVTNGLAAFQRVMDKIKSEENLLATFIYVDNITIAGKTQAEHDANVAAFLAASSKYNLQFNESKTISNVQSIQLLGYLVSQGSIQPDPDRVKPLLQLPPPENEKALARVLGLLAHYSRWIQNFSTKIRPLSHASSFPLNEETIKVFNQLKQEVANSILATPDLSLPFFLETDASDYAIGATLSQNHRPVAFFSRTLNKSECKHHSVEKEAYAIVESTGKWRHYLLGTHFTVVTDQQSVSFMFNQTHHGKIKNDKIARWRIELSAFSFDIIHRPGILNVTADPMSRLHHCASIIDLRSLHDQLCHPGISRMYHFVRSRNLPFSMEDVKKVVNTCRDCAEIKPNYFKHKQPQQLIKALAPFERINIDFKGPLPSSSKNKYILTMVDEYSRYPFAFPLPDTSTENVKKCMLSVFGLFGMPNYIHSDNGSSLISKDLKNFLLERGISTSNSTRYNPPGNGQVEKFNGVIWKAVLLALKTKNLVVSQWELVLTDVLHSLRSLLCTATNETPHERIFKFPRKSTSGSSVPSWLLSDAKALMKKHVRRSKFDPLVEEVEILDVNPNTSHVRTSEGRELTVSNKHLAPTGGAGSSLESYPLSNDVDYTVNSDTILSDTVQSELRIENDVEELHVGSESGKEPVISEAVDQEDIDAVGNDTDTNFVRRSTRNVKQTSFYGV